MELRAYVDQGCDRFLDELKDYCRIPSVAAEGRGLDEATAWVRQRLERLGATVDIMEVDGSRSPAVLAALGPSDAERTLLIYNHYDVQPPDPLELWDSPPFEPTVRDGRLFARGVADNKSNFLCRAQAVEAWQATRGALPIRILWLIEGEEEIGSINLPALCAKHGHRWAGADGCLWESGYRDEDGRLVLYSGLKGLAAFELRVHGANSDKHSSSGTLLPNAAWRLTWALSTLKAPDETILIDGLMDEVIEPTDAERRFVEQIPFDDEKYRATHGVAALVTGVTGTAALMRHLYQPTCTITGLLSGYTGEHMKTVLPCYAFAKVGFRLVPNLTPERVGALLRRHLDARGFPDVEVVPLAGELPAPGQVESAVVRAALRAARDVMDAEPVLWPHMVGTGPMYEVCTQFGVPAVGFGAGNHQSNVHAPNENVRITDYLETVPLTARFYEAFAAEG